MISEKNFWSKLNNCKIYQGQTKTPVLILWKRGRVSTMYNFAEKCLDVISRQFFRAEDEISNIIIENGGKKDV